jgi:hypothetical protein
VRNQDRRARGEGCGKRRAVEKSKNRTFPPRLEIQQKTLDSHFSHSLDYCWYVGNFVCRWPERIVDAGHLISYKEKRRPLPEVIAVQPPAYPDRE